MHFLPFNEAVDPDTGLDESNYIDLKSFLQKRKILLTL